MTRLSTLAAAMHAEYGRPRMLPPDVVDDNGTGVVRVYAVRDREAARAYAVAEREVWDNPARAELREAVGWVVVVDLRPKIETWRREHPLPRRWA